MYSPAQEKPLRAEFFGDELDTMGYFDPITQRRTENVDEAVLLPVAETEPATCTRRGYPACARTCAPSSRASSGAKRPIRR